VKTATLKSMVVLLASLFVSSTPAQAAVDADGARSLAKSNDCLKCHAVDKDKKGPSLQKIAAKYKGKADGQDKVMKSMTEGKKVKLSDGTEEEHKKIDSKDPKEIKNLADWILAQ
jgi:cytochrome c